MGHVKFKDQVIFNGPVAHVGIDYGWNDSMATYYPAIIVSYITEFDEITTQRIVVNDFYDPDFQRKYVTSEIDSRDANLYAEIFTRNVMRESSKKISVGKNVVAVKGLKVPKGTEGTVIYINRNKFGEYAHLKCGDKIINFVSTENLKVVDIDESFEKTILDIK